MLTLAAAGFTDPEIAVRFRLATRTVKNYLTGVYAKLGVRGRIEAFAALGWLKPTGPCGRCGVDMDYRCDRCRTEAAA